jgi:GMP synthase (glutamine-hydrolysing)
VYLAQGTLRPDLIESASKLARCDARRGIPFAFLAFPDRPLIAKRILPYHSSGADAIKTHHNDTDLVRALRDSGRVIEPLRDYHKDEVLFCQ